MNTDRFEHRDIAIESFKADVTGCSECGSDHKRLLFQLSDGIEVDGVRYNFRAACPRHGKPIFTRLEED